MNNHSNFDDIYSANNEHTFGDITSEELKDFILTTKLRGNALDIGCGDGRDTLFLANVGFFITALDLSNVALEKLKRFAESIGIGKKINTVNCDVRVWDFPRFHFDLVTSAVCLDHITKEDLLPLFEKIVMSLKPGGIIFFEVHTVDDPGFGIVPGKASELSNMILHYFQHNELLKLVEQEFEIIRYEEKVEEDKSHGKVHFHGFANVLARKKI